MINPSLTVSPSPSRSSGETAALQDSFLAALAAGKACLHPTDTLPGLAFDPASAAGRAAVVALKGRVEAAPFLGLVASAHAAQRFWQPLPRGWERVLARLWPGPISVVWEASEAAPAAMVAGGRLGLRAPRLAAGDAWLYTVMRAMGAPLPTTSVNETGHPPLADWDAAAHFVATRAADAGFVPLVGGGSVAGNPVPQPSTIIELAADGRFTVRREGAFAIAHVRGLCAEEGLAHALHA